MTTHDVTVIPVRTREGRFYRALCSCKEYESKLTEFRAIAETSGAEHARAKTAEGNTGKPDPALELRALAMETAAPLDHQGTLSALRELRAEEDPS